jgi:Flp pilus assembly protein TadG
MLQPSPATSGSTLGAMKMGQGSIGHGKDRDPRSATGQFATRFLANEHGGVTTVFGLMLVVLMFAAGAALDIGRVLHTRSGLATAADAAALAAGRALSDGNRTDAEIRDVANAFFKENLAGAQTFGDVGSLDVAIDREQGRVKIDVSATVPMTLSRVAGFNSMDVPVVSESATSSRDIELAMVLDVTGSMQGSKISDLRAAASDLVHQIIPDQGRNGRARIALAPYAASVNAGSYFNAVTGKKTGTGCVFERSGSARFAEDAPRAGSYLGYDKDVVCPSAAVQPLTENKRTLMSQIGALRANGQTAGHIGTAWGWYLLSPLWSSLWPSDGKPADYNADKTLKAVLLMTDGEFNTQYVSANGSSSTQAKALCQNMKDAGVEVYTVGFMAGSAAEKMLRECASSPAHYFTASNGAALSAAFRTIGRSLTDLHLTQ